MIDIWRIQDCMSEACQRDVSFLHNRETAIKQFADFMQRTNTDQFMDAPVKRRKSDAELAQEVRELLNGQPIGDSAF